MLFAQMIVGGVGIVHLIIIAIVIAAIIGIALICCRAAGINVPSWVVQIGWIIVCVIVAVVAIRFLAGLAGIA